MKQKIAYYHLPGLFEFYDFYKVFLPLYQEHREYFYDWCEIASIYGNPSDCLWSGGRVSESAADAYAVFALMKEYDISPRLTFSNCLLNEEHLKDERCNKLCQIFSQYKNSGIIITSDVLLKYLKTNYPTFYYVSSTTKVLTDINDLIEELNFEDYKYVVADFRFNKDFELLSKLNIKQKNKIELLCNECCPVGCQQRKQCYENVSRLNLGINTIDYKCKASTNKSGYRFSIAKKNPSFISIEDIKEKYLPLGINNFKIEGRSLGSAIVLEILLYYLIKPEYQLEVRENIYLDSMLDLF